jgi:ABC-type proline/glycine betaine transport system permease subunit
MHPLVLFLYAVWIVALYVLPTAIAFSRKKKHRWIIAIINILGGWIYGVPWLIALVWALLGLKTDGSKGFKVWPVGLSLVVAPLLFGALGAAIGPKKETKKVVQASATPVVQETVVGTPTATPAQESAAGTAAASITPTAASVEQPAATPGPVATAKPTATPVEQATATPGPVATAKPTATPVEQATATRSSVATIKPAATPKAVTAPSPTPKPGPLHKINNDVLAAYSKEDFTEMMDMYAIHDTDAVKQMVSEGKVVGLRKGALVYLEDVDLHDGIVKVRPKESTTTVWIPSQFLNY